MTPREQAAFNQGVEAARQMAVVAAVTIETRGNPAETRQRAPDAAFEIIAADPSASGVIECPASHGGLGWNRDSFNGHVSMVRETAGCLTVVQ